MKRFFAVLFCAGVLASGLVACSSTMGRKFDTAHVSDIRKGVTTKQEVIRLFGSPTSTQRIADGRELLTYYYLKGKVKGIFSYKTESESQTLQVTIRDGIVSDFSYAEGNQ